uniref:Uncharacterized protein n=1 Tax=Rhizophora mucronata TaxID=61149 RepID=A0A2P2PY06_RHIMU
MLWWRIDSEPTP